MPDLVPAHQIGTAIADIGDIAHIAAQYSRNAGGAHAAAQHIFRRTLVDGCIGAFNRLQQWSRDVFIVVHVISVTDRVYRYFAGNLTCCMSTHTVSDDKQGAFHCHHLSVFRDDIGHIIFVMFAFAANIG